MNGGLVLIEFNFWNLFTKFFDAFVITYVPYKVLPLRFKTRNKTIMYLFLFFVSAVCFYGADYFLGRPTLIITLLINAGIEMLTLLICYEGHFSIKTVFTGGIVSVTILIHYAIGMVCSAFSEEYGIWSWQRSVASCGVLLLFICFFIHFAFVPSVDLPRRYGTGTAVYMILVVFFTHMFTLYTNSIDSIWAGISVYVFAIGSVCFLYYLFFQMLKEFEEKTTYKMTMLSLNAQKLSFKESAEVYNQLRMLRHELKNKVFYMQSLLEQNKIRELKEYFQRIYTQETNFPIVKSGNNILDSLLNQKSAYAKSKSIPLSARIAMPSVLTIKEWDFCSVISNLLDNAIEGCEEIPDPRIVLTIQQMGEYIHVQCKNRIKEDILSINPELKTTKKTEGHGMGIQIIRNLVEKYDGMFEITTSEGWFTVNLMMVCPS